MGDLNGASVRLDISVRHCVDRSGRLFHLFLTAPNRLSYQLLYLLVTIQQNRLKAKLGLCMPRFEVGRGFP